MCDSYVLEVEQCALKVLPSEGSARSHQSEVVCSSCTLQPNCCCFPDLLSQLEVLLGEESIQQKLRSDGCCRVAVQLQHILDVLVILLTTPHTAVPPLV